MKTLFTFHYFRRMPDGTTLRMSWSLVQIQPYRKMRSSVR